MKRRKKVMDDGSEIFEIEISSGEVRYDRPERDADVTLWNLVLDYVSETWPSVKVDQWGSGNSITV